MARMGLPKKYIKLGGGVTKKAWRLFKAAKSKTKKVYKKVTSKKKKKTTAKKKTTSKKKTYSSKPKKRKTTMAKKKSKKTYRSKRPRWSTTKAQAVAIDSVIVGGGVLGSTWAMNMIPWIKNLSGWQRALTQFAIGVTGVVMTPKRNTLVKKFFGGTAVGSVLNFAPNIFPNLKLSGKNRRLTPGEMSTVNMGIPHKFNGSSAAKHTTSMGKPVNLGVPVNLNGGGGRFRSRGHRSYAGTY